MIDAAHLHRLFGGHATELAPALLGCELSVVIRDGEAPGAVTVLLTEVEAYGDQGEDPGAHSFRGRTARNASLFGPSRRTYVYLNYGLHHCLNLVCGPEGTAGGVLLRGAEVLAGRQLAVRRRRRDTGAALLAGPGNLGQGLGVTTALDGTPVHLEDHEVPDSEDPDDSAPSAPDASARFLLRPARGPIGPVTTGRRVGVSGIGGGEDFPWRYRLTGRGGVSAFRAGRNVPPPRSVTGEG